MKSLIALWAWLNAPMPGYEHVIQAVIGIDDIFVYLAVLIVSYVLTSALTPKPEPPPPSMLKDFDFPQVDEGTPQAVVFGDVWLAGWMVLNVGNFVTEPIYKSEKK